MSRNTPVQFTRQIQQFKCIDSPGVPPLDHKARGTNRNQIEDNNTGHQRTLKFLATAIKTYAHNARYENHFTTTAIFMNFERKKTLRDINSLYNNNLLHNAYEILFRTILTTTSFYLQISPHMCTYIFLHIYILTLERAST